MCEWTWTRLEKRWRSAELFLLFRAGQLWDGQLGGAELGDRLGTVIEGHALQGRVDQMFSRTLNSSASLSQ